MNLVIKSMILDAGISALITLVGGGSFYSLLFLFAILFLPAILVFVSFGITGEIFKASPNNDTNRKKGAE